MSNYFEKVAHLKTNKFSDKTLSSQSYVIHHKSHTDWRGIKLCNSRWEEGDWPLEPWQARASGGDMKKGEGQHWN